MPETLFDHDNGRRPNLAAGLVEEIAGRLRLRFVSEGGGDLRKSFGPEDVCHYVYAVFHCPTYRTRYAEFLKTDFPRLPLTSDLALFRKLCGLGGELVGLHLLEKVPKPRVSYPERGDNIVDKPRYVDTRRRVYVNKTQFFSEVPPAAWECRIGGFQVCQKWLKDRTGRQLSFDDIEHYRRVVTALEETLRVMGEIDAAIPRWPME
jgi:predicted helicase